MKTILKLFVLAALVFIAMPASAQSSYGDYGYGYANQRENASITFRNKSDYTMTLKILYLQGGLYQTVVLYPHSAKTVEFSSSNTFKLKIKAVHNGYASYHKGGNFSVTCTPTEWTEGEMSFMLSTYGNGLGPKISSKEFESNN